MNNGRAKIEQLKNKVRNDIEVDIVRYRYAIIREIDALWRSYKLTGGMDFNDFADYIFNYLRVPERYKQQITDELQQTQFQIGEVWESYFKNSLKDDYKPADYEKLIALYQVDFPSIDKDIRDTVVTTFRESVRKNYTFEAVRNELGKTKLGTGQIYTLANTAVSMFDNSAMFAFARQAGINQFKYDGFLQENSRIFCVKHFHKIYTYEEILLLDNGQEVPVVTSCGGYNCHHYWTAFVESLKNKLSNKIRR